MREAIPVNSPVDARGGIGLRKVREPRRGVFFGKDKYIFSTTNVVEVDLDMITRLADYTEHRSARRRRACFGKAGHTRSD
jgi:hypothetical protein